MLFRLTWFAMAAVIGLHGYLVAAHGTPDPCRAVGEIAAVEYRDGIGAQLGIGGEATVAQAVERRLRAEGLTVCYGALGRVLTEGGVGAVLANDYGIDLRRTGS